MRVGYGGASTLPSLAVLVPVLARPQNVAPLVASLNASVARERAEGWDVRIVFVCSPGDDAEIRAVRARGFEPLILEDTGRGQYAKKINHAVSVVDADWYLTGADDVRFEPGWLRAAIDMHIRTGALVIGTNDLANPTVIRGDHATHSLVHRDYLVFGSIDEPGELLRTVYDHNSVDCEFVETAKYRGQFAHAAGSVVAHMHPTFDRSIVRDATYRKGLRGATADKRLFRSRQHLWGHRKLTAVERRRLRAAAPTRL